MWSIGAVLLENCTIFGLPEPVCFIGGTCFTMVLDIGTVGGAKQSWVRFGFGGNIKMDDYCIPYAVCQLMLS